MCERSPLFLFEAKSIVFDLLKCTFELFDLTLHFIEYIHLKKYLLQREKILDSIHKPCQFNSNVLSDLKKYTSQLHQTCRLIKTSLRSLNAARITSSNDYTVIDDEIYELIQHFQFKLKKYDPRIQIKILSNLDNRRYYSQRQITNDHAKQLFIFLPINLNKLKHDEHQVLRKNLQIYNEYSYLFDLFKRILRFYQGIIEQYYGVKSVRDSHLLQPIVISIIRLHLIIVNQLNENIQYQNKNNQINAKEC